MMFHATFNNISAISWQSPLLTEKTLVVIGTDCIVVVNQTIVGPPPQECTTINVYIVKNIFFKGNAKII
jgi:hypothetical protein